MTPQRILLLAGLVLALSIVSLDRLSIERDLDPGRPEVPYTEVASVLWTARIYPGEIRFLSADRVFHTLRFEHGELHRGSVSYRNLSGYFDPVLVTVWQRGATYRAMIVDPVRQTVVHSMDAGSEIDVSVSADNRIVLATFGEGDTAPQESVWP